MRIFVALLLASAAVPVFAQNVPMPDPMKTLFDNGVKFETAGRLAAAKLMFTTLAATYEEGGAPLVERSWGGPLG